MLSRIVISKKSIYRSKKALLNSQLKHSLKKTKCSFFKGMKKIRYFSFARPLNQIVRGQSSSSKQLSNIPLTISQPPNTCLFFTYRAKEPSSVYKFVRASCSSLKTSPSSLRSPYICIIIEPQP